MAVSKKIPEKNKVIMVTGYSGSGKTELSSMLREEFNGHVLSVGKEMRSFAKDNGFNGLSDFIRQEGAVECFEAARPRLLRAADALYQSGSVIIDGLYENKLAEWIVAGFGSKNCFIVNIFADMSIRINRVIARTEGDIIKGSEEVKRKDSVKLIVGVNDIIERSDFSLDNNSNAKDDLRSKSRMVAQCVFDGK
ncbi:MAG: AAA family ATPase [Candidatus Marsarchaeota archaeon]|nr:AAA family ATPase [Candidatus Marsarchaeota archaeon]